MTENKGIPTFALKQFAYDSIRGIKDEDELIRRIDEFVGRVSHYKYHTKIWKRLIAIVMLIDFLDEEDYWRVHKIWMKSMTEQVKPEHFSF